MAKNHSHTDTERHTPYMESLKSQVVNAYARMLKAINETISQEMKREHSAVKSNGVILSFPTPLLKADAPAPATPSVPGEPRKIQHPGIRGGHYYRDEHGNVVYGDRPDSRFKHPLTEEEEKERHFKLSSLVSDLHGVNVDNLAKEVGVNAKVLYTYRDAVANALALGRSVDDVFIEGFLANESKRDAAGNIIPDAKLEKRARDIYSDMEEAFRVAARDPKWQATIERNLKQQKQQSVLALNLAQKQAPIIEGQFHQMLSGDIAHESIKQLGILWDLGLFTTPKTLAEAKKYTDDEDEAYKMVDMARVNLDRFSALSKSKHLMSVDQKAGIVMTSLLAAEQDERDLDPTFDRDAFWQRMSNNEALNNFRAEQKVNGIEYSDVEWKHVKDKLLEGTRSVSDIVKGFNDGHSRDLVGALINEETSLDKLIKNPNEVERIKKIQIEKAEIREKALKAQVDYNHPLDETVDKAIKKQFGPNGDLYSFQKAAVSWIVTKMKGILAYDAGTGKTPICIAAGAELLRDKKVKRNILILPSNLMDQWPKEIEKFRPGSKVQVVSSNFELEDRVLKLNAIAKGDLDAEFVVMSAGTVGLTTESRNKWNEEIEKYKEATGKKITSKAEDRMILEQSGILDTDPLVQSLKNLDGAVFFDEIHSGGQGLKDPDDTHHAIAKYFMKDRQYTIGMTATPMTKDPEDLYHLSNLFDRGLAGESLARFTNRIVKYDHVIDPETGEDKRVPVDRDMKELAEAKNSIKHGVFFQSKTASLVVDEMAKKNQTLSKLHPVSHALTLDPESRKVYEECQKEGWDEKAEPWGGFKEGYKTDKQIKEEVTKKYGPEKAKMVLKMRAHTRMQRAAISPRLVDKNYKGPEPKIDETREIINRHFANPENKDRPVIIFSEWLDSLDLMKASLTDKEKCGIPEHLIGTITGDVDQSDRDLYQEAANQGKLKVVLVGIKAGGAGLNLQGKRDKKTGKDTGAFRTVFLSKPGTPADMEQAVGRTYRFGNPADTCYVHHLKVADTTDERRYTSLGERVGTLGALSVADLGEEYLSKTVSESMRRLVGSWDESVKDWTPEQKKESLRLAGLPDGEIPPLNTIAVYRDDFNKTAFADAEAKKKWLSVGDQKIKEQATMAELKFKSGKMTATQYKKAKKEIARAAKEWLTATNSTAEHPVAQYIGESFNYGTEADMSIAREHTAIVKPRRTPKSEVPKADQPEFPIAGETKLTPESKLSVKMEKENPYKEEDPKWAFYEALKRTQPKSVDDATKKVANWIYDYYSQADEPISKEAAESATKKWFDKKKILNEFRRAGLIEVAE